MKLFIQVSKFDKAVCGVWRHFPNIKEKIKQYRLYTGESCDENNIENITKIEKRHAFENEKEAYNAGCRRSKMSVL